MSPVIAATRPEVAKCKPIPETTDSKEEKTPFTISRHKKIHLSVISPRICEDNFIDFIVKLSTHLYVKFIILSVQIIPCQCFPLSR